MQRYWVRIAVGALAVFAIGMAGIALVRSGITRVAALAKSNRPIGIPLALLPFRLEGEELGAVRRLELLRNSPSEVSGLRLTVSLRDSSHAAGLRECAITLHELRVFGGRDGFTCSSSTDSAAERLEKIGEIVFEPGGLARALLAPGAHAARWRTGLYDTAAAKAELMGLRAQRHADPTAHAVIIRADSTHAVIDILGDAAPPRLPADSIGASFTLSADSSSRRHKR